jgi:hypothetical protein
MFSPRNGTVQYGPPHTHARGGITDYNNELTLWSVIMSIELLSPE